MGKCAHTCMCIPSEARKAGKLWVFVDDQLVWEHVTPRQWSSGATASGAANWQYASTGMDDKTTAVQSVQIRPFQQGLIWGVQLEQEMGLIKVLWIESGRFAFNMDQSGYSAADGVVVRDVVHCRFSEEGMLEYTPGPKPWRLILNPEPCDTSRSGTACAEVKQAKCPIIGGDSQYLFLSECPELSQCLRDVIDNVDGLGNTGWCLTATGDVHANTQTWQNCVETIPGYEERCNPYRPPSALLQGYELVMLEPDTPSHATYGRCPCKKENLRKGYAMLLGLIAAPSPGAADSKMSELCLAFVQLTYTNVF
ncbi:unnamed protein product [Symbiodinium sp. CCMP2592]|nr:unnamed protein product [Symbiodinium sp. CCMP2592]